MTQWMSCDVCGRLTTRLRDLPLDVWPSGANFVLFRPRAREGHEVWEELWLDCPAADRRFYQSLIQAAVALYHWGNGNLAGATRLFPSPATPRSSSRSEGSQSSEMK